MDGPTRRTSPGRRRDDRRAWVSLPRFCCSHHMSRDSRLLSRIAAYLRARRIYGLGSIHPKEKCQIIQKPTSLVGIPRGDREPRSSKARPGQPGFSVLFATGRAIEREEEPLRGTRPWQAILGFRTRGEFHGQPGLPGILGERTFHKVARDRQGIARDRA
jgi:hypothetical protein